MARRRFYAPPDKIEGSIVNLSSDETHHLMHVLRMTPGDDAFVFDGCGKEYRCSFRGFKDNLAQLEVKDLLNDVIESPLEITLAQGLAKGEKFEFIVQKATELGVRRIVPLATRYAEVKPTSDQIPKKLDRWRRISLEAMKQSGRRTLVEILAPRTVREFLSEDTHTPASRTHRVWLLFNPRDGLSVDAALGAVSKSCPIAALIGPEGGWSDEELTLLSEAGCKSVSLGPRVLRTETAAVAAITLIQHTIGDISRRASSQ
ncbi:MAG: 16S rRNA (uracil(1498)-N(3))-methyltransferase [Blastocatellia bacterium]